MRTEPVRTVTLPHMRKPEPLIPKIDQWLEALSIFDMHAKAGMRVMGIRAVEDYFRDQWEKVL